ncbi:MAG: hypothetical protein ACKPB9_30830 [Dolichospermum sp.]
MPATTSKLPLLIGKLLAVMTRMTRKYVESEIFRLRYFSSCFLVFTIPN